MDKPVSSVELETMLLGRHSLSAGTRRGGGHLDRSAYTISSRLQVQGPMSVGELRDAFGLDTSTLHRQTTAMREAGLIERIPDPEGGMARKFRLTAEGERLLDAERAYKLRALDTVLKDWTAADVATFAEFLKRFNTDIERLDKRPWPRP